MGKHEYLRIEPRDCTTVRVANPYFIWAQLSDTDLNRGMTFTLDGPNGYHYEINAILPRVILPENLPEPGDYRWNVSYWTRGGQQLTSLIRSFRYVGNELPDIPTAAYVKARIDARLHPRIIPQVVDDPQGKVMKMSAVDAAIRASELKTSYANYLAYAEQQLGVPLTTLPEPDPTKNIMDQASVVIRPIEAFIMAALVRGDIRYHNEAISRLKLLAAWNPEGLSGDVPGGDDQANRAIMRTLALGLDALYYNMSKADRDLLIRPINIRLEQNIVRMRDLHTNPYNSHLLTAALYSVQTLMHAANSVGEHEVFEQGDLHGDRWEVAWNTLVTSIGTWRGGTDSAFGNSIYYGWMTVNSYATSFAAFQLLTGVDLSHLPATDRFGENFYALTPRLRSNKVRGAFGDGNEDVGTYFSYAWNTYRTLAHVSQNPLDEWYYRDGIAATLSNPMPVYASFYEYFLTGKYPAVAPAHEPSLRPTFLFEDAGVVAMHSNTIDPKRSSLFFRSSRLGSYNHNHADNNAFTFVSKGKNAFISGGVYKSFEGTLQEYVTRATRFKNALTFDAGEGYNDAGIGQAERVPTPVAAGNPAYTKVAHGKLINFYDSPSSDWAITTGDATGAYQGQILPGSFTPVLTNAVRTVAYNRAKGIALIYDWADSAIARRWRLNYQTLVTPQIQSARQFKLDLGDAISVCLMYHGLKGTYATEDMDTIYPLYDPKFVPGEKQYHTTYTTNERSTQFAGLAVVTENCTSNPAVIVSFQTSIRMLVQVGDSWLLFDKRKVQISE
ncbi:heparinase II/III-like protein [Pseudoduganella lurida]|uniref:Heparinase II/III-like protein n=2 Tax=Pseudoduganella lurida TaxID=1036180 RepID=A0A562R0E8_9BURK|nr:heparinase II/III-like protein [Pseudoduganella lurida]